MSERKYVKWYYYVDVAGVNSLFNQLYPDIQSIEKTMHKENAFSASAEIPALLQGFSLFNLSGEYDRDIFSEKKVDVKISIEDKINAIEKYLDNNESKKISDLSWETSISLIAVKTKQYDYETFISYVDPFLKENTSYPDFQSFLETYEDDLNFSKYWEQFIDFASEKVLPDIKERFMPVMNGIGNENRIFNYLVTTLKYPVLITYSGEKMLLTTSQLPISRILISHCDIFVIGYLIRIGKRYYKIKPLVMWCFVDTSDSSNESFFIQAKEFHDLWNVSKKERRGFNYWIK